MDDLTDHAERHCSHLSKDTFYWRSKMIQALLESQDGPPSFCATRYSLYRSHGVPEKIYEAYDIQAFHTALGKLASNAQAS